MGSEEYIKIPYTPVRKVTEDLLSVAVHKHMIHGLIEVDITRMRKRSRELRNGSLPVPSLTSYVVYCCAQVVAKEPLFQAYRTLGNQLLLFSDVDVSLPIERHVEGTAEVVPYIIRNANKKTVEEIDWGIQEAKNLPLNNRQTVRAMRMFHFLPGFFRRLLFRLVGQMPHMVKRSFGTVMVTSVGMFGRGAGWGLPICTHTLNIAIGGVVKRPILENFELCEHEYLCVTVSFDHDIVDGAPAARFIHRFKRMVERCEGLQ